MIIKKYTSFGEEKESSFSPIFIGGIIVVIIILIFAIIAVSYNYLKRSDLSEESYKSPQINKENSITPAGEEILSKLQKKVTDLNRDNQNLNQETKNLKKQNADLKYSINKLSLKLNRLEEEKKFKKAKCRFKIFNKQIIIKT